MKRSNALGNAVAAFGFDAGGSDGSGKAAGKEGHSEVTCGGLKKVTD